MARRSPRTQYAEARRLADFETMDVLPNLSRQRLRGVHEEFTARGGAMDCATFVMVLKAYLPSELVIKTPMLPAQARQYGSSATDKKKPDESELVARLVSLFNDIDTNGSGYATWSEVSGRRVHTRAIQPPLHPAPSIHSHVHVE